MNQPSLPLAPRSVPTALASASINILLNHRQPGERFEDFKARRRFTNKVVKQRLRGRFVHVSSKIGTIPPAGADANVDDAIALGKLRDVSDLDKMDESGRFLRTAREKGTTYRRPKPKTPSKVAQKRARTCAR